MERYHCIVMNSFVGWSSTIGCNQSHWCHQLHSMNQWWKGGVTLQRSCWSWNHLGSTIKSYRFSFLYLNSLFLNFSKKLLFHFSSIFLLFVSSSTMLYKSVKMFTLWKQLRSKYASLLILCKLSTLNLRVLQALCSSPIPYPKTLKFM